MSPSKRNSVIAALIAVVIGLTIAWWPRSNVAPLAEHGMKLPTSFSVTAIEGRDLFNANCSVCHGKNGSGTDQGPPLVHVIYEPNHHGDPAFYRAAQFGVRRHHWPFGDMPPVPAVTRDDVTKIIAYVRELQRANGIH